MEINKYIAENYKKVESREMTLQDFTNLVNKIFFTNLSAEAVRARKKDEYKKLNMSPAQHQSMLKSEPKEFRNVYGDGCVEALKLVHLTVDEQDNPKAMLKALGYNPNNFELVYANISEWQQHTKEQVTKTLYAVKYKIKPKAEVTIDTEAVIENIKEIITKNIKPIKLKSVSRIKEINNGKLMELPPIELHLGKQSCHITTGQNYDQKIAQDRFNCIIEEVCLKQEQEKCGSLLISIGGDFFNSDNNLDTTNRGTQMHSDMRSEKMFLVGLKLWIDAIEILRNKFNFIKVQLCVGNHDKNTSFHLFVALKQAFKNDDRIEFIENYKEMQCFVFGDCGIWTTHGTRNVNATMDSIVSEFSGEYGITKFREVHFGHLHTEQELKERLGIIPRRLSSPTGKDEWEYNERFGDSIQKQQVFVWSAKKGLLGIFMIPFEPVRE